MRSILKIMTSALALCAVADIAIAEPVTLEISAWKGTEAEPAGLPAIIELFEAAHPDIKVKFSYIGRPDMGLILPPRFQSGNAPDILMSDMNFVKTWAEGGFAADLGSDNAWNDRVLPGLKDVIVLDGANQFVPIEVVGIGLFVNEGLLAQAGIERAPKTIDELIATCAPLNAIGVQPLFLAADWPAGVFTSASALSETETPFSEFNSGDSLFADDPAANQALDTVRRLIAEGCVDVDKQAGMDTWSTALAGFTRGAFAMTVQGAWNIASFSQVEGLDYSFGPIPTNADTGIAVDVIAIGWTMNEHSKVKEAATQFIDFFLQPEIYLLFLKDEAAFSAYSDGLSGLPDLADNYAQARSEGAILNYPYQTLELPGSLEGEMGSAMNSLILDLSQSNTEILSRWDDAIEEANF
ncbi:MAG: extracellular solute-binding protein [Paracoccaceae bacterium]